MATIAAMRDGLKTRLNTISGLRPHDNVDGNINPSAAVVVPKSGELHETFEEDPSEFIFEVVLLVSRTVDRTSQDKLDAYLAPAGAGSIAAAIASDPTLGGIVSDAYAKRWRDYGFITWGGIDYVGAVVEVGVMNA